MASPRGPRPSGSTGPTGSSAGVRARRTRAILRTGALLTDLAVLLVAGRLAFQLRTALTWLPEAPDLAASAATTAPGIITVWLAAIAAFGGYSTRYYGAGLDEYRKVFNGSLTAAGATGTLNYLLEYDLSRPFFLLLFALGTLGLLAGRYVFRKGIQAARRSGRLNRRVLLVGAPLHIDEVAETFRREAWLGLHVVGAITSTRQAGATPGGVPILGEERALAETVLQQDADVLLFVQGATRSAQDFRRIAWDLEEMHVSTAVVPALTDIAQDRVRLRPLAGLPIVHVEPPRAIQSTRFGKRAFDVVLGTLILIVLAPVLALVALAVKLGDHGPVIFRQTRIGRDGAPFELLKFRTMVVNAEALRPALAAGADGVLFKLPRDPRITTPGAFLRRFSLDELPQLVNVLRGEMSLVGPRPALPHEVARYDETARRRLRVRPGLTGLWQVSGRSDLSWEETVRLDVYYVDNWSFVQDLAILLKTVRAVLGGTGAY